MIDINKLRFDKQTGLIPAIVVDDNTNRILMLAYMNRESLQKTFDSKLVTFFSRSRNTIWIKGESSGNYLDLVSISDDCDNDTLLVRAKPRGPVCHTGEQTCFGDTKNSNVQFLEYLNNLIAQRRIEKPEGSYTTKLFEQGTNRIIQKVGEEAIETVIAAKNRDKEEIKNESADLIFHLLVMLTEQDIQLSEVVDVLIKRHK